VDRFCTEGWKFALKGGIRHFDAWENRSPSGVTAIGSCK
jgi:hypothetical protein